MSVLADTEKWHVEFETRHLWITSRNTGLTLAMKGEKIATDFRECLKTHSPDRVTECFIKALGPDLKWERVYKQLPEVGA